MVGSRRRQATGSPIQPFLGSLQEIIADPTAEFPFDFIASPSNRQPDRTSSIAVGQRPLNQVLEIVRFLQSD